MRKMFGLAALALALPVLAFAFKLPPMALGPYVGAYLMDCTTINNQVLCVNGDPSLGAAPVYGGDLKVFLPGNYFSEISLGYSPQKTVARVPDWPEDTITTSGRLTVVPLVLTLGHDFRVMPKFWWSAGISAGYTFATVAIDTEALYSGGRRYSSRTVSRGGGPFLGLRLGIDLNVHRNFDLSVNLGYRYGNIKQLTVKESDDTGCIGNTLKYYDESSNTEKLLPLEISNPVFCYVIKYRF